MAMYKLYDNQTKKFFRSQDGFAATWDGDGITMEKVDADIRVAVILKNNPEMKDRLEIVNA